MSWPLSHTDEAYVYASDRIAELPRRILQDCAISWKAHLRSLGESPGNFNVRKIPLSSLISFVQDCALGEHGRCSNGGFFLYVDPEGWTTVPFSPNADEE